jgi:hypothetical protein
VINVLGLEFDEEHNGVVSFQIYLFLKNLKISEKGLQHRLPHQIPVLKHVSHYPLLF